MVSDIVVHLRGLQGEKEEDKEKEEEEKKEEEEEKEEARCKGMREYERI